ncbi:MAG: hypothetical protein ACFFAH_16470 [Promethearchaeota archaeon]
MERKDIITVIFIVAFLSFLFICVYLYFILPSPYNVIMLYIILAIGIGLVSIIVLYCILFPGLLIKDIIAYFRKKKRYKKEDKKYFICPQCNIRVEREPGICPKCGKNLLYSSKIVAE